MRHLSESGLVCSGRVLLSGQDLLELSPEEMRQDGAEITLVPQNPSRFEPSMRVGESRPKSCADQKGLDSASARQAALDWFEKVHLADPE
jgi:ABC-type glutathione transport system ATPase component